MTRAPIEKPIGVIGNDDVGLLIARRIAASGRRVIVGALGGMAKRGGNPRLEFASTPTDVAFECSIIIAAIEDTEILKQLVVGDPEHSGLGAEMSPGSILVDTGARTARELGGFLGFVGRRGVAVIDAAVIGAAAAIEEGRAKILLGGYPDSVELVAEVLAALGTVEKTGPLGSAHAAGALMGYIEAAHAIAREEALALGGACGLAPEVLSLVAAEQGVAFGVNVVQLEKRAELARRIARDRGFDAEIINLATAKRERAKAENR